MELNQGQREAAVHHRGPCIVIAPPGSGKTSVITERIIHLIRDFHVPPHKILVVTFTKAAAGEMKERFRNRLADGHAPVWFGTFHSVFFTILKHAYHYRGENILREHQKKQFLREILDSLSLEIEDETEFLTEIEAEISLVKGEMISAAHYYSVHCPEKIFRKFYYDYEEKLRRHRLIDFDDMLVYCYELFAKRPDILKMWQQQYEYILIDEFQDINRIQYDIIKMLAAPENNLFVVGDDDQSIYRFRGAKPEIMLNFQKTFPEAEKIFLDMNYRSTGQIIKAASLVIQRNQKRYPKKVNAARELGDPVAIRQFESMAEENKTLTEEVMAYHRQGIPFSQMAVIFRTNTQPRALLQKLMEFNIPFSMKDRIPNIYEHWIHQDMEAYIKMALGEKSRKNFLRIMNRPKRYISREYIDSPEIDLERLRCYYEDKAWMLDRIDRLEYDWSVLRSMAPYAAIQYIRKGIGYDEFLVEYGNYRNMKPEELFHVLDELQELSRPFPAFDAWFLHIEEYGRELKRQAEMMQKESRDAVVMSTMHGAKGLEYEVVFIIDANEGIMPHKKAVLEADLEEERRMFYVAMTRAKSRLHIYYEKERYNKELGPSRFLNGLIEKKNTENLT